MKIPADNERCMYTTAHGHRCRMTRLPEQSLCPAHSRRDAKDAANRARREKAMMRDYFRNEAVELLFPNKRDRLDTAYGVNRFLACVARLVAEDRLDAKTGAALSYIGQTLLSSLPHLDRERSVQAEAQRHPIFGDSQGVADANQLLRSLRTYLENETDDEDAGHPVSSSLAEEPNEDSHLAKAAAK